MSKKTLSKIMVTISCLSLSTLHAQPPMLSQPGNAQQTKNNTLSPDDFKKEVKDLAQKNLDSLNKQLSDMLAKQPPPPVPPPPPLESKSTDNKPVPPKPIEIPAAEEANGAEKKMPNQPATTPTTQTTPPTQPMTSPNAPPPSTSSGSSTSSSPPVYTGFQGVDLNKKDEKKTNPSGGFNIKY